MTLTVPVTAERRSYSGSVVRLLAAVALVMTSNGVLLMLWGVRSTQAGFGSTATSVVLACYYVGFLAGSVSARRLMGRLGTSWSFTVMGGIVAGVALLAPLRVSVAFWSALRVLQGFCFAAIYVIVESWFNRATANHVRGRVLGVYLAVVMGAFAVGSLVFARAGTGGTRPFVIAALIAVAGIVVVHGLAEPTVFMSVAADSEHLVRLSFAELLRRAPLGVTSAFVTSIANSAFIGSLGVWATRVGYSSDRTAVFAALGSAGPLLVQYPFSWWSDRASRATVMFTVTTLAAVLAVGAALGPVHGSLPFVVVFILGGLTYTQYSIYMATANDPLEPREMPAASGLLILVTGLGSITGVLLAGVAFRLIGDAGMYWVVALGHALVAVLILALRRRSR